MRPSRGAAPSTTASSPPIWTVLDYLGVASYMVAQIVRIHAAHFSDHTWQVRYVRGTFSRAFGADKRVFDPF